MSACRIVLRNVFGVSPNLSSGLACVEDHQIVYVCGHQAVVFNTESKEQSFIQATTQPYQSLGITAIACSPQKRIIALAERVDPVAAVTFYDSQSLKRKKILQYNDLGSRDIKCMAFSADGRLCITQGTGPDWNLVLWNVEKAVKVVTTVKIAIGDDTCVNQVSFCPWDPNLIIVIGKSLVRLFRVLEGQMRPVSLNFRREANFLSHAWLWDEKIILGTDAGEIVLIEKLEFRVVIYPTGQTTSSGTSELITPILSLSPMSKGFIAGTTGGELRVFEESDEAKEQYKLEDSYNVPKGQPGIIAIASSSEDTYVCVTDSQQLLQFTRSSSNSNTMSGNSGFDYLIASFHAPNANGEADITGIDVALWKPLCVTCGKDNSVRVWNVRDKRLEIMKEFPEEPTALSVHPSGIYVVVAFIDKIRLLHILLDNLHTAREFQVRNCPEVKFSKGGQYIAAINNANVQIYNTYTGASISTLRYHNSRVRSISWANNDCQIFTIGAEGSVYFWDVFKGVRRMEQYTASVPNDVGVGLADGSKVYTSTADRALKEISIMGKVMEIVSDSTQASTSMTAGGLKLPKEVPLPFHVSCLAVEEGRKLLFGGTSEPDMPGSVLSTMIAPYLSSTYELMPLHSGRVSAMCLSRDGSLLLTGDSHGCLCISEIESGSGGRTTSKNKDSSSAFDFMEEVLINRSELEDRKMKIQDLQSRVEVLSQTNEYQLRAKEMQHADKIKEITQTESSRLHMEQMQYDSLQRDKASMERKYKTTIAELEAKQSKELGTAEARYKAKLSAEAARHRLVSAEVIEMHRKWDDENRALVESHQVFWQSLTAEYEAKLEDEHSAQRRLQAEKETLQVEYDMIRANIDSDADVEIDDMKNRYEARLKSEEETGLGLLSEHTLLKKNDAMINKQADIHKADILRLRDKESKLLDNIKALEKDIQSHKKEIREREETIADKEKRIFDLKKKNQELEKFRFVLDYKIKELKLQIAPRESEIATMRKQIEEMDLELDQYHKSNAALNLMIGELKLKLDGLRKEVETQSNRQLTSKGLLERFMRDLNEAYDVRHDYRSLKHRIIELYQMYVQGDVLAKEAAKMNGETTEGTGDRDDHLQQYNRDREQMERNLEALKRSLKTDANLHKRDLAKMMRENVVLTKEINDLRKDAQGLLLQQRAVDNVVQAGNKANIVELMESYGIGIGIRKPTTSSQGSTPSIGTKSARRTVIKRSTALRTTSADMNAGSAPTDADQRGVWREVEMQKEQISQLEEQVRALCVTLAVDVEATIRSCSFDVLPARAKTTSR